MSPQWMSASPGQLWCRQVCCGVEWGPHSAVSLAARCSVNVSKWIHIVRNAGRHSLMALVDIIDFKWLMAHEGWRVHVERLQHDMGYARECLARADTSSSPALLKAAASLRRELLGQR